jgi:carboxylesterase
MDIVDLKKEFFFEGGSVGCLIIHGFTGTPGEHITLGKRLRDEGYTVLGVRLKGHGTTVEDMEGCTYGDWIESAVKGYERLKEQCNKVYVIGHSMGSLLALYLGEKLDAEKIIALSPPLITTNKAVRLAFILKYFKRYQKWGISKRTIDEAKYLVGYPKFALSSVHELNKLRVAVKKDLYKIKSPLLIIHSRKDLTVAEGSVDMLYNNVSSTIKEKVYLNKCGHNITIECEKEEVFKEIIDFIK